MPLELRPAGRFGFRRTRLDVGLADRRRGRHRDGPVALDQPGERPTGATRPPDPDRSPRTNCANRRCHQRMLCGACYARAPRRPPSLRGAAIPWQSQAPEAWSAGIRRAERMAAIAESQRAIGYRGQVVFGRARLDRHKELAAAVLGDVLHRTRQPRILVAPGTEALIYCESCWSLARPPKSMRTSPASNRWSSSRW